MLLFYCLRILHVPIVHFDEIWSSVLPFHLLHMPLYFPLTNFMYSFFQTHWVHWVLLGVGGCRAVYWSMSSLLGATSIKGTDVSSPSSHQLPIGHLRVEFLSPSLSTLRFWQTWFYACWVQHVCNSHVISGKHCSTFSSAVIPEPWECIYNIDVLFRAEHSAVSYSLHDNQMWVSILTTTCCKKKLLTLILEWTWVLRGGSLMLCPFRRMTVVSSFLGPMT